MLSEPTRKERRREQTRRDLAAAAVRLFEKQGYAGTTVDEIADAANVSESTFFRLFGRKEDVIFFDLPERLESLREDFAVPGHASAWETVRSAFVSNAHTWDSEDAFGLARARLFHAEPALKARYVEICLDWEDAVADIVAAERGVDPRSDLYCRVVANSTVSAFRAAFIAQLQGGGSGIAEHLSDAFDLLEAGLHP